MLSIHYCVVPITRSDEVLVHTCKYIFAEDITKLNLQLLIKGRIGYVRVVMFQPCMMNTFYSTAME